MKNSKLFPWLLVSTLLVSVTAFGADKGKKGGEGRDKAAKEEHAKRDDAAEHKGHAISTSEREIIQGFISEHEGKPGKKAKDLPPGLKKKIARGGKLPPGWEKKLVTGEVMPPEVWAESQPLPHEIIVKLPVPPPGTVLRAIEGHIVRVMEKTREILDVFDPLQHLP